MSRMRRLDLMTCTVNDEIVILDRAAGRVHQLNPTASHIWMACDGRRSTEDIAAGLAATFEGAPDSIVDDVTTALADLEQRGLLVGEQPLDSLGGVSEGRS